MTRTDRRQAMNVLAQVLIYAATLVALVPLGLVLISTTVQGWPAVTNLDFLLNPTYPEGIPGGGVSNAIVGTLIMVGLASVMAIPLGIVCGVYLVEYGHGRWADGVRLVTDILVGTPSIAVGIFCAALLVPKGSHTSAMAGAVALAILMLPVVTRTTEGALALIPSTLREAGLALGISRSRVALQLVLPAAVPGVVTGALLAVARAAGETAPILFTDGGSILFRTNPTGPVAALPLIIFEGARSPYQDLRQQAWGAALVLMALVLAINLLSRFALRRQLKLAGKL